MQESVIPFEPKPGAFVVTTLVLAALVYLAQRIRSRYNIARLRQSFGGWTGEARTERSRDKAANELGSSRPMSRRLTDPEVPLHLRTGFPVLPEIAHQRHGHIDVECGYQTDAEATFYDLGLMRPRPGYTSHNFV
jgi:hypothetical protein